MSFRPAAAAALLFVAVNAVAQAPPPAASETITVTATRSETRVADTPASVVVLTDEALAATAGATLDDALRQVAGFTLFRRYGSRTANPTAQGVTLRGIGPSGASRALVLDEGIPLNDAFGGWVYWGRVPRMAVERLEVVRGGVSDLYGSSAVGGVIQLFRKSGPSLQGELSAGSQESAAASAYVGGTRGEWNGSLALDFLTTGGYVLVAPAQRGDVDVPATSRHTSLDATVRRGRTFIRGSFYDEARDNGTPMQENETRTLQLASGTDLHALGGVLALRAFGTTQDYRQTFSAVAGDRNSERLTVDQEVPSSSAGLSAQWTRAVGGRHVLIAGSEVREVEGDSDELRFTPSQVFTASSGGTQRTVAAYVEDVIAATSRLTLTGGVRFDRWRNLEGEANGLELEERTDTSWSPRVSALYRSTAALAFSGSIYQAFRAPSLNELYRGFRVGNVQTLANEQLGAEKLTGFEAGVRLRNARVTLFSMESSDAIANVTLAATESLITRQRRNLGSSVSRGLEADGEWRIGNAWRVSAGWLYADSTVSSGDLRGKRVAQVPLHSATAQLLYASRLTAGLQTRWSSMQYDDDRNELPLDGYFVADLLASVPFGRGAELTLAIENLFDAQIEASATPVITHGQPRAARVGVRWRSEK